jgi:argininosuccinate lyase
MKLWEKGLNSNEIMHRLTVGDDPFYDKFLLPFDCLGTSAHADVLLEAKIIDQKEYNSINSSLHDIYQLAVEFKIDIPSEYEDCHTTLENILTQKIGDTGKKIHTGRSRNDQIILTQRLFLRTALLESLSYLLKVSEKLKTLYERDRSKFMPGYTHLQTAMPSTVGIWWHSVAEAILLSIKEGIQLYQNLNINPLGAAAGFGSGLNLNREISAKKLNFDSVQRNFVDIQNSRGRFEEKFLFWATKVASITEKFAWDLSLFSTKEFGFVKLPVEFTTGSSIMPQKRNPDLVELLRARSASLTGSLSQIQSVLSKLPSNYHRDLQLTKPPFFDGLRNFQIILEMFSTLIDVVEFDENKLSSRKDPELFATYEAYRLVQQGIPFREAYQIVANQVSLGNFNPKDSQPNFDIIKSEIEKYFYVYLEELGSISLAVSTLSAKINYPNNILPITWLSTHKWFS